LAAILDRLPDALLLIDAAGVVENANAKALEAFGAGPGKPLIGLSLGDLLPSLSDVAAAVEGADGKPRQMVARALDGMVFGVEATCTSVPWGAGEERLLICMHQTAGGDAEAELVRTGRAAQAVLRSTEEAICGVDRDGRVVLANPAAGRLFGVRVSAIAGQDLHAMVLHTKADGTPYPAAESPVARTLRSGRRIQRRREIVWRADGTPVPVEISTSAIRDGAEVVGAVLALTDVTERHELDRRRRRLVDLLVTRVEPGLAAIAESADAELAPGLRAALAEALDYENLMDGQGWDDRTPTQLGPVVDAAIAAVGAAAAERGVRIDTGRRLGVVQGNPVRLTGAVAELLRIAIAASSSGEVVAVATESAADRLRIRVTGADTGGAADPLLQRLRAPRGAQRPVEPDLAFVQLVAEGHDGRLLIESADSRRSYVLELPPATAAATGSKPVRRHARVESVAGPGPLANEAGPALAATEAGGAPPTTQAGAGPVGGEMNGAPPATEVEPARVAGETEQAVRTTEEQPAKVAAPVAAADPDNVIPMPARRPTGARATGSEAVVAVAAPPGQVLTWPRATPGLADALNARGLGSTALDRAGPPAVMPPGTAIVLIDPQGGTIGRRMLRDLSAAVTAAGLPLILTFGFTEFADGEPASEPPALVGAVFPDPGRQLSLLVVEEDPAVAGVLGARLTEAGYLAAHARTDARAAARAKESRPDLVLRNLAVSLEQLDWLRAGDGSAPIPVVAYTTEDLTPGHEDRLSTGQTKLGLAARAAGTEFDDRLAALLAAIGG